VYFKFVACVYEDFINEPVDYLACQLVVADYRRYCVRKVVVLAFLRFCLSAIAPNLVCTFGESGDFCFVVGTATLGMLFGVFAIFGRYSLSISAFIDSAATIIFVYTISRVCGRINITHLLLSGVAISMIMDDVTRIITLSAPNALGLNNAIFWMSGSLAGAKWGYLTLPLAVLLVCMFVLLINYRGLNLLLLGDEGAGALRINVRQLQKLLVLVASLMAGVTIAVSGSIGFVGLMVPHFTRLLVGGDHPDEMPVGILTAIIGVRCLFSC
jgi:ABC-type Fe3+-siderophore transport system permease subunit